MLSTPSARDEFRDAWIFSGVTVHPLGVHEAPEIDRAIASVPECFGIIAGFGYGPLVFLRSTLSGVNQEHAIAKRLLAEAMNKAKCKKCGGQIYWKELPNVWAALGKPPLLNPLVRALCSQAIENVLAASPFAASSAARSASPTPSPCASGTLSWGRRPSPR